MAPELAKIALQFLARTQLQGAEVPAFTQVVGALNAIAIPQGADTVPTSCRMLERTFDADRYLRIVRHPEVEPFVTLGQAVTDEQLTDLVCDRRNVLLLTPTGGFLYVQVSPEIYEVHTAFTPEGRGPAVVTAARKSLAYVFRQTEALAIRTFVAHDNRAARRLALGVGFVPLRDAATLGTPGVEYLLTVKQWVKGLSVCQ